MSEERSRLDRELDTLRTLRDEFEVQAHLGRAEVRELWEEAERRWHKLEAEVGALRKQAEAPLEQVEEAAELLVDEVKSAYHKLRELI